MAEQINLASLIISIIILIVVLVLVFMICYYYNTNNNSTKSIQNPQALAAAALYKNNFSNSGKNGTCHWYNDGMCCYSVRQNEKKSGYYSYYGMCESGSCLDSPVIGYSCEYANQYQ
jgi:hypothetical protein